MSTNTVAAIMPIAVFCTLCGFSMPFLRKPKLQTSLNVYCLVVAVLQFTVFILFICTVMHTLDYTVITVLGLCTLTLEAFILVYYQIKFVMCLKNNRDVIENIVYVDQSLERLHMSTPRTNNKTEFSLLFLNLILFMLFFYKTYYVYFSSQVFDYISFFRFIYIMKADFSHMILFTFCCSITNILKERLRLVRCALEKFAKRSKRTVSYTHLAYSCAYSKVK